MLAVSLLLASVGTPASQPREVDSPAASAELVQELWADPRPVAEPRTREAGSLGPTASFLTANDAVDADMPREVVITPDGTTALVVHRDTDNLVFFDLATRTVVGVVAVGDFPVDVAVTPDGTLAVTTNVLSNDVSVVDVATRTKLADVPVTGLQPFSVEITPDSALAVVAVINDGVTSAFSVIDLGALSESVSFPTTPQGVIGFFGNTESGIFGNLFTKFALSPDGTTIVLPDRGNAQVTVWDRATGTLRAALASASLPSGVDVSSDGTKAVVSHEGSARTVTVIDLTSDTLSAAWVIGSDLNNRLIRITPDGTHAICSILNAVVFVNLASGAVTSTIATGDPGDIEISFDGQYAFVSNFNSRVISIAGQSLVRTLTLAPSAEAALSPSGLRAVALNNRFREDVHVYDINGASGFVEGFAISGPPPEGDATRTLAISGDGGLVVAANNTSRTASVIELATGSVRSWIPTGDRCLGVAVSPDGTSAVVCNGDEDTLSVLDLTSDTLAVNLPLAQRPAEALISPDGQTAYVTTIAGTDRLHFIHLAGAASASLGSLVTGQMGSAFAYAYTGLSGMSLSPDGSLLGVCISFDDQLMIVDTATRTETARVAVGDFPYRVAFSADNARAWVINTFGDNVTVVDVVAASAIATVGGIDTPSTVDVHAGAVYVANTGSPSLLKVIDAGTNGVLANVPLPIRVRDAHLDAASGTLFLAGANAGGEGRVVRVRAAGASSAVIDETPLAGSPADLVFSPAFRTAVTAQPVPDGVDLVHFPLGASFCDAADGALALCPCANPGAPDSGCDNAQGTGGVRAEVTGQNVATLQATLTGTGFPPASAPTAILIRGNDQEATPVVLFDGLRCVGLTGFARLAATSASGGVSTHAYTHAAGAGTFYYQIWYRNTPASFCGPAAANLSNGQAIAW